MTGQKERACPCCNTDKLKPKGSDLNYITDPGQLQSVGVIYQAADSHGREFCTSAAVRIDRSQYGELVHWLEFHLKGQDPPPALYALEMLLKQLEFLRGGRQYVYNSIRCIQLLEE